MKIHTIVCLAAVLCACACATPGSKFYMLNAMQQTGQEVQPAVELQELSICVGPVLTPDYLDRAQMCVRDSGNRVRYAEYHRWAEPLESAVSRVLVENLSLLLHTARIDVFPWKTAAPVDYQVRIMLIRFDGEPGGQAVLKARWSLEAADKDIPVFDAIASIVEPVDARTYEALARAQNRALEKLSRDIAMVIHEAAAR